MRFLLVAALAAALLAGCTKNPGLQDADTQPDVLLGTLPGEADLPPQWIYMAKTTRPATAAYDAHGMTENPGPASPSAFEGSGGAFPDSAAGALFLLRSSNPLQTLYVFTLDFDGEDAFRGYLANTSYCKRSDDFALVSNGEGLAALAVGANLSDADAVFGALDSWWDGQGFSPAC